MHLFKRALLCGAAMISLASGPALASEVSGWSGSAAGNNFTPPHGWPSTTMLPTQVAPTARELMASVKRLRDRAQPTVTSAGSANVQTLTYTDVPAAYVAGDTYSFTAGYTNTGATTLNVNGLGAKTIRQGGSALVGGEIKAGRVVTVHYDGTYFEIGNGALPSTVFVDNQGLNVALGTAPVQNNGHIAVQVVYHGSTGGLSGASSLYTRTEYNGSDATANVNGLYGTIWYEGSAGSTATAVRGNFYSYSDTGSPLGVWPNQYFASPNIGTLTISAGIYGRSAHYLPGTIEYAAGVFADGLYNVSTPAGGVVTVATNFLAAAPYTPDALNNFTMLVLGGNCSPSCYDATITTTADPIILRTPTNLDINMQAGRRVLISPSGVSALTGSSNTAGLYAYMTLGADAFIDSTSNSTSESALHLRSYAGSGVFNQLLLDQTGKLRLNPSGDTIALSGSANPSGIYSYILSTGHAYLDALFSGADATLLHLRTYNNGTYYDSFLDTSGRLHLAGYVIQPGYTYAELSTIHFCDATIDGATAYITDSTVNTWGAVINVGGGANKVLAFCNSTSWTVAAK